MIFTVIETGGKQYKVEKGDIVKVEKLNAQADEAVVFDRVLLKADKGDVVIGQPYIENASVEGVVVRQGKEAKKIVFRYHSKTRYRKKKGHKQPFTEVKIIQI